MRRIDLLGVKIDALTIPALNAFVREAVTRGERWIIANHNLHSVYLYHRDPKMRAFYERAMVAHIDGMALVFLGRLLGLPLQRDHRVTYVDWVWPLLAEAARRGWRVFYLGSKPGVAERGAEILRQKIPSLQLSTAHGYFNACSHSPENRAVLQRISASRPHVLMVGMGMPRQERWILENLECIHANVILTAGACMDYLAGVVPTPPRWLGRLGLEWLYRLISEPKRLWRRYLLEPWFVLGLVVRELSFRLIRSVLTRPPK